MIATRIFIDIVKLAASLVQCTAEIVQTACKKDKARESQHGGQCVQQLHLKQRCIASLRIKKERYAKVCTQRYRTQHWSGSARQAVGTCRQSRKKERPYQQMRCRSPIHCTEEDQRCTRCDHRRNPSVDAAAAIGSGESQCDRHDGERCTGSHGQSGLGGQTQPIEDDDPEKVQCSKAPEP